MKIKFDLKILNPSTEIHFGIYNLENQKITHITTSYFTSFIPLSNTIICEIPKLNLAEGHYYINILLKDKLVHERYENCLQFHVSSGAFYSEDRIVTNSDFNVLLEHLWINQ